MLNFNRNNKNNKSNGSLILVFIYLIYVCFTFIMNSKCCLNCFPIMTFIIITMLTLIYIDNEKTSALVKVLDGLSSFLKDIFKRHQ